MDLNRFRKNIHLIFILIIWIVYSFYNGCEKLPTKVKGPDNPLDPDNPNNIINGPTLILSPTKLEIESNDQFHLELWVVESDSIAGMSTRILFDTDEIAVDSVDFLQADSESFLLQNGGRLLYFSTVDNDSGYLTIDCAMVEGNPRNVMGGGRLLKIFFHHLSGTHVLITISEESYLRNSYNETVNINKLISSEIILK